MFQRSTFKISALPSDRFRHLFGLSEEELDRAGVVTRIADAKPGYPCRVTLRDAEPGTRMLLLNYQHQDAATPYRSSHAIFVCEGAQDAVIAPGEVPEQLRVRLLSVRAFSAAGMMIAAEIVAGEDAHESFVRLLQDPQTAYLHVHFAKYGCYAARVDRA